jgi:DnaD/phage-associated family protein
VPKGDILKLKADPEDGTAPIARLFLDALPLMRLSGLELRCVLYLWRRTYGWFINGTRLKERPITLAEWADGLLATRPRISEALTSLEAKKVYKRKDLGQGRGYIYEMNTHVDEWVGIDKAHLVELLEIEGMVVPVVEKPNPPSVGNAVATVEVDPKITAIYKNFENNIHCLTARVKEILEDFIKEYGVDWVTDAVEESIRHNARNVSYIEKILENWKAKGRGEQVKKQPAVSSEGVYREAPGLYDKLREINQNVQPR